MNEMSPITGRSDPFLNQLLDMAQTARDRGRNALAEALIEAIYALLSEHDALLEPSSPGNVLLFEAR